MEVFFVAVMAMVLVGLAVFAGAFFGQQLAKPSILEVLLSQLDARNEASNVAMNERFERSEKLLKEILDELRTV